MIHPTYRLLDAPVKFAGLALRQWVWLLVGGSAVIGIVYWLGVPTKPAISVCTIVIGVPAIVAYASEETGLSISVVLRDVARWRVTSMRYAPGAAIHVRGFVLDAVELPGHGQAVAAGEELEELLAL